ncbi:MAG: ATP-binding cassette domain-containing protein [Cyanobacteria bacterium WB6_1B_304]|jgi:D-methionine transport system ATP-binding protein|nr:ATP-binding cassette domain-containing protein [Cyanobacteria bacterium WB6_1B_304]
MASIKLEQVSLIGSFSKEYRLRDLSFEVAKGEWLVLVGASGCGKTSVLRLLNRLQDPSKGHIYYNQRDIQTIPIGELRQQVTLVLQESKLLGMTVEEALAYPLQLRGYSANKIQKSIRFWQERLQLSREWWKRRETELSVGQRQMVAIARALTIQPQVLLLDEPTSSLDYGRSNAIFNLLRDLINERSLTIIMASHQLELAEEFATQAIYLQDGCMVKQCPVHEMDWVGLREALTKVETNQGDHWTAF